MNILPEMADYMFDLPPELVAQKPPAERGGSRLMVLPSSGGPDHRLFADLPDILPAGALLVVNDVRVTQARLLGRRLAASSPGADRAGEPELQGKVEAFILEPPPPAAPAGDYDLWCLVHPGRRVKPGAEFIFQGDGGEGLRGRALEVHPDGRRLMRFYFADSPEKVLDRVGHVPLPYYIKRPDLPEDRDRYQTVYSRVPGAVAAPTAGLHFTRELLARLAEKGFSSAAVTLKVSAGTFAPLTRAQLESGRLHREHVSVPQSAALAVAEARSAGRPVVAVGTTTARALEWAAADSGRVEAREGWCDLFIRPGHRFRAVDGLVTNFHLPGSSLLLLVSALAGREKVLAAYRRAVEAGYRFYSYGDAMLIL